MPYVAGVTSAVVAFFVSVMLFGSNPFERLAFTPADGRGLNPQLQNAGHGDPPADALPGLHQHHHPVRLRRSRRCCSRRLDTGWIHAIRKWTLVSWLFLSIGITLGMWWAYVELGWGGYWAWDPVENASLLPWLTMTAFLHSVMIQEKRGMLKRWNLGLDRRDLPAQHLRHVHHPLGRDRQRAQLHPVERRATSSSASSSWRRCWRSRCSTPAGTLLEAEVQLESHAEPRGGVPVQQPAARGHRVLGAVGHAVPDPVARRCGAPRSRSGPPFFNRGQHPARAAAAGAHRHRPAHRLAQGVGGQPPAAVHRARGVGLRDAGGLLAAGMRDFYAHHGARAGRLRGRHDRAGVLRAACGRGGGCTASRCRWRSPGWSRGTAGATAATSCTRAS